MNYLLDTCVISELTKPAPDNLVMAWLEKTPETSLFLSVITVGEICKGLAKLPNSSRKTALMTWWETLRNEYDARILPVNTLAAENWGLMTAQAENQGTPMSTSDAWIAAIARTHNMTLITRNVRDFTPGNISIFNPWES